MCSGLSGEQAPAMASREEAGEDAIYGLKLEESDFVSVILQGQKGKRWPLESAFVTVSGKRGRQENRGTAHKLHGEPGANCF